MKLRAEEVSRVINGELVSGPPEVVLESVSIDSRATRPGDLFFAIRGPNHDGHAFVADAVEAGAIGVVASETVPRLDDVALIRVADTTMALQELAHGVRERAGMTVVAITGSMGKTTTKEAAAAAIANRYKVLKTSGNLNNQYGLPLTLLSHRDEEVAVVELGMSSHGEIARLTEIAEPNVGVLTNVAEVHLEFFSSVADIARAKGELFSGLSKTALAVVNADDPLVLEQANRFRGERLSFGLSASADVRASEWHPTPDGLRFTARYGTESVEIRSKLFGRHNVYNLLAGLAAAVACDVPVGAAAHGLEELTAPRHRGERVGLPSGVSVIDETYNSNPKALSASLDMLDEVPLGRKIAVVGDMLELGARSIELHRLAGADAARRGLSLLIGVGPLAEAFIDGAREAGMADSRLAVARDPEQAGKLVAEFARAPDVVLFKGSRSVGLERAIELLQREGT